MPIQLWSISYDTKYITAFLKQVSTNDRKLGIVCSYSDFQNRDEVYYGSLLTDDDINTVNNKIEFSKEQFLTLYPNCFSNTINESTEINLM
jgi:hypothetical protein